MIHRLKIFVYLTMKNFFFIKLLLIYLLLSSNVSAIQSNYFEKGIKLYKMKKFEKSKFLFEREIAFNPKHEKSYLYLAKIFKVNDNDNEQEINLNNVLLLNPLNDEAIYMLTLLKIKQSDYNKAKILMEQFDQVCKSFCSKKDEMKEKFSKLTPDNAEAKN